MIRSATPIEYCLYRHIRPDKNQPFYIGIGTERRSKDCKLRTNHWKNIYNINNNSIEIDILVDGLTWEEACKREIWWIQYYGRSDQGKGPLVNLTDGGEGACGRKKTEATLQKFRNTMDSKGTHHMKGYKHTEEARKKIAEAGRRKKSPEEIQKIINTQKGRKKPVDQILKTRKSREKYFKTVINTNTGEEYPYIIDASKAQKVYTLNQMINRLKGKVKDSTFPYKYKD